MLKIDFFYQISISIEYLIKNLLNKKKNPNGITRKRISVTHSYGGGLEKRK